MSDERVKLTLEQAERMLPRTNEFDPKAAAWLRELIDDV